MSAESALTPDTIDNSDDEWVGDFPSPYGQYLLLHRLARGGMGNVFLAKTGGTMGIEKHCVVKTLRLRFTHDPEYVQRFMQEARFVVQLTHRNICPVFDVGRVQQSYYLAMELIVGRDVRSLLNALAERGRTLSRALAIHIACEILDALDYAHRHVDNTTGEPLHIVHRDVSPQNVMINIEGEVKLIDFGLAESGKPPEDAAEPAIAATVMGKMSYMAPEQARGEVVDARADQFAAAVVCYELLTGHRYYEGLTSEQVWQQAGAGQFKPAGIAELPRKLRDILEKALAAARDDRHATCGDFRDALLAWARKENQHAGPRELRTMMGELFSEDLRDTRELLQRFAHVTTSGHYAEDTINDTGVDDVFQIAGSPQMRTHFHDPTELVARSGAFALAPGPKKSKAPLIAAAAAALVVAAALGALWGLGVLPRPSEPVVVVDTGPPLAPVVPQDPVNTSPATSAVPATTPPTATTTPTTAPTTSAEPEEKDPTPAHKKSHATSTSPKKSTDPASVPFGEKLRYLTSHCASKPCTVAAQKNFSNLGSMTVEQTDIWKRALNVCYDECRRK